MTKVPRSTWQSMKQRCLNPSNPAYRLYGGRGITICARWRDSYEAFIADMGPRPIGTSIDRIDNDGNYEPGNCRWATPLQQERNKSNNVKLLHNGQRKTVAEWADELGVPRTTIYSRHARGWPLDGIVTKERKLRANERNAAMVDCKFGHPFTPENTLRVKKNGTRYRRCRICFVAYQRAYCARKREEKKSNG